MIIQGLFTEHRYVPGFILGIEGICEEQSRAALTCELTGGPYSLMVQST